MPFTAPQLAEAAKVGLDYFLKNEPIDIVKIDRPLYKALQAKKKAVPGAKQFIVEQVRVRYSGNFQWYRGTGTVTYNTRNTVEQAQYPWQSAHDGLTIDEDRLAQNGIVVTDDKSARADDAEMIQLTDLMQEQAEVLRLGFEQGFSMAVHLDGTLATDALVGLDALVTTAADPVGAGTQVVGGLDRFSIPQWRNQKATAITQANLLDTMETQYRAAAANGGGPDAIFAGGLAIDTFRKAALAAGSITRFQTTPPKGGVALDPSITDLHFHGIPIQYCPEWDDNFGGAVSPTIPWSKRMYMLNLRQSLRLRPLSGQDMVSRKPPRPSNQYVVMMAMTWKGGMTLNNSRTNVALSVA